MRWVIKFCKYLLVLALLTGANALHVFAKEKTISITVSKDRLETEDEMGFEATPGKKEALFDAKEKITYKVSIQNIDTEQSGTVGYTILSLKNEVITQNAINIKLDKKAKKEVTLTMPSQPAGFYKLNITLNVTEYDDTIRRVFGVDPKQIKSDTPKPEDFDNFWYNTKDSLSNIPMQAKVTLRPDLEKNGLNCYLVEVKSWGNVTVRGWLTLSKHLKPGQKLPVWLVVPGYGGTGVKAIYGNEDLAVLAFNVRGQGNSKDVVNPTREGYLTTNIENKYKYILRGALMDCIRAVDFICSRPELDSKNIILSGGSMGAYFTLAVCSMDKRIRICSANNPVFSDYRSLVGSADWPMHKIQEYSNERHIPMSRILNSLDYYDLKNFAGNVQCKAIIGISLLDNLAPPYNEYVMLNNLKNQYKLFVYPNLGHEVPPPLFQYLSNWMMDQFGLF